MAETTTSLVSALARRIRDSSNLAHPSTNVINLFSHIQRLINAATSALKSTVTLALPTAQPNNIYDATVSLPTLVRVERVLYQNKDVVRANWRTFIHINPYWARATGTKPMLWDRIGLGVFVVTPSIAGESISCIGPRVLTALTVADQATELPNQHIPAMLAMAEQLLLMRQRLMKSVKPSVETLQRVLPAGIP